MDGQNIIGIIASVFTAAALLPQLIKVIREKESEDVSVWMLAVLFCGLVLWIMYGFFKKDYIITVSNAFSLLVNITLTVLAFKYKKKK
jgi:MtN3 and saliva related transmembrane protein